MQVYGDVLQHPANRQDQQGFKGDQGRGLFVVQPLGQQSVVQVLAVRGEGAAPFPYPQDKDPQGVQQGKGQHAEHDYGGI